jgi:Protein of unknown function (DUF4230)
MVRTQLRYRTPAGRSVIDAPPRRRWMKVLVGGAAVVALIPFGAQVAAVPGWSNPFQQQSVDRSSAPLLTAMRDVAEFRAATGTYQVLVDLEHDTPNVPAIISGERTTFFATGSVDSVVDFSALDARHVTMSPDRLTVTISLPAPVLRPAVVDPAQSRVVGQERGIFERVTGVFDQAPRSEQELWVLAARKLDAAAATSNLPDRAEQSTRSMLTTLALSMGFQQVNVVFDPAVQR